MSIFLYEFLHFKRNKAKLFCYLFFMILCILSILNGFEKYSKQINTISQIEKKKQEEISNIINWFENNEKGPEDRPWVDIENPFWAIYYTPTYVYKLPSDLFPLGIGQSEQFGYYKKITRWSSTYDTDMIEEISNFERLVSAKDEKNAVGATFLFNLAHYALRPWPWILIALSSLIIFPELSDLQRAFPALSEDKLGHDVAYPAMLTLLPSGLLGLVAVMGCGILAVGTFGFWSLYSVLFLLF